MSHHASITFLKISSFATMLFGALLLVTLFAGIGLLNFFADLLHMPLDGVQKVDSDSERTLIAILAGVLIGIATFVWQITQHVYAHNPRRGAQMITISLLAWYLPDNLGSLLTGAWFNVVMNSVFLAMFLLPLYLAKRPVPDLPIDTNPAT